MAIKTNELPYQTYERITGKKWGSDPSAYKTYGVTSPAGSAAANLQLQSKLLSSEQSTARPVLNPTPATPTPTPTATPAPTKAPSQAEWEAMGNTGVAPFSQPTSPTTPTTSPVPESAVDKALREYYNALPRTAPTDSDQEAIREAIRKQMQAQIDAINTSYDSIVASARTEGENRLGQTRAISSRSGMLGAPMGDAQQAKTTEYNQKVVNAIEAERASKVAAIWDTIDQRATERIEKQKTEALTNAKDYIDYLKTTQEGARTDMVNLAKSGVDLSTLSEEDYKTLLEQTGYNPVVFKSLWNSNLPENQKRDYNYVNLGNGKILIMSVDPKTNKMEKEEYSVDIAPDQEIKEFDGVPYIAKKDENGNVTLQNIQGFDYGATSKKNLMELRGGLYDIKTNKWVVAPKADSGSTELTDAEKAEMKKVENFQKDAAEYIQKLDSGDLSWGTAYDALKAKYTDFPSTVIDNVLGGGMKEDGSWWGRASDGEDNKKSGGSWLANILK